MSDDKTIGLPEAAEKSGKGLGSVVDGVIGSTVIKGKAQATPKTKIQEKTIDTVALKSSRNISWQEVGKLEKGINIVSKNLADKWLTLRGVELLTPEQVAKEFDN